MVRTRRFQLAVSAVVCLGTAATSAWAQGTGAPTPTAEAKPAVAPAAKAQTPGSEAKPAAPAAKTQAPGSEAKPAALVSMTQASVPEAKPGARTQAAGAEAQPASRAQASASETQRGSPEPVRTSQPVLAATRIRDGDALMRERRYREAAFAFLDAEHAAPDHVEARFKLGNALAVLGYYGRAIEEWEHASRLTQDAAIRQSAQDNIARARAKQEESGTSPQATGQAPGSGPVADTTRAQARRAYEQGVQHIGQRAYAAALQTLTQALQQEPLLTVAYIARGSANIGLRRYAEAAADYQFALKLEPDSASPLYGLAEAYRALGRNLEARDLYERYARSTASDVRPELKEESRQKAERLR
ncbi:tetratricopeptide repeat protein [Corallococcus silvisoli]|uniref:tetratricopeptide repeat protein n=1 Tax=Corallococcus silvisoli TaxID=2697031 RepID=UPI001377CC92|nr:tetratricopeptide repeat protein [Corallococcus silvisoli]NBD10628.1 tetratricopeptide repeat protein [Corallococcus silvisoli]